MAGFLRTPSGCAHSIDPVTRGGALTRLPLATLFDPFGVRVQLDGSRKKALAHALTVHKSFKKLTQLDTNS